jgi:hypothetical protein
MPHPDPEILLRFIDQDLSPSESSEVSAHLLGCGDCRDRVRALEEALGDYGRFHRHVLKPSLPPPPRAWRAVELPRARPTRWRLAPWLAAAAAVAALFFVVRRFEDAPEVRAAELLRKASVAEQAAPRTKARIRIRRGSHALDRSAVLLPGDTESTDAAALHAAFDAAGYPWEDPLSAGAFSRWRDSLPKEQDQIEQNGGAFTVRTASSAGALSSASLTLRAADLHALACTLSFRGSGTETIDISELPDATSPAVLTPSPLPPRLAPPAAATATVGDELHVIAALHRIGADLGEPVEVRRSGDRVQVLVTGLDQARRDQIRAAVSGIAVAQITFEDVGRTDSRASLRPPRTAVPADRVNPVISDLLAHLGNGIAGSDLADELIDATDRAAGRAFALRTLARRFPPESTSQLSPSDAETLAGIVRDHTAGLGTAIRELRRLLAPILPNSQPSPSTGASWQQIAEGLPVTADRLDRTLNGASDASDARKARLAELTADLVQQATTLEQLVRP